MTKVELALGLGCVLLALWSLTLTVLLIDQRRRHNRLIGRVSGMSANISKISRMRHTGSQTKAAAAPTRAIPKPAPPFPVPPPSTNPIATRGRHSAT